jgi:hypothetical protein
MGVRDQNTRAGSKPEKERERKMGTGRQMRMCDKERDNTVICERKRKEELILRGKEMGEKCIK